MNLSNLIETVLLIFTSRLCIQPNKIKQSYPEIWLRSLQRFLKDDLVQQRKPKQSNIGGRKQSV